MAQRVRKYLLFMFGNWSIIEKDSKIMKNIKDVMDTIVSHHEFSFVTGDRVIIMCVKSRMSFEEIDDILKEFLTKQISSFFLMPKPRKLSYRLDKNLEDHLFSDDNMVIKSNIKPEVAKLLSEQLKNIVDSKLKNLITDLDKPVKLGKIIKSLRPMTVDGLLDKIIDGGVDSLTTKELEFLNKYNK